jgi:ribosome-associated protein
LIEGKKVALPRLSQTESHEHSIDTKISVEMIIHHIMEKKGEDIVVLDLRKITSISDYFIIAQGNSNVQVKAIADEVKEKMAGEGLHSWHVEGMEGQRWILLDYVDIVVHIFDPETRHYYDIEKLYDDAERWRVQTDY